jgi:glycerol-3-phosphate acyltransferase PlsX
MPFHRSIAIDAMGGDKGPIEVVEAVGAAFQAFSDLDKILLVGDEAILEPLLKQAGLWGYLKLQVCHASEVIGMDEKPIQSMKQKKDASMFRAIDFVKDGAAQVAISQGNTGSLMAASTLKLRPLSGFQRPALGTIWPGRKQHFVLLDAGANPEAKPEHLVHNALLGSHYCRLALKVQQPRIGLLTIGTEEGKGNELIQKTHDYLKQMHGILNYIGPIEGFGVFQDAADVVVCDGFLGNVVLKTCESLFRMIMDTLKGELTKTWNRQLGALLAKPAFDAAKLHLNPDNYAGAPLLGLKGHVLKTHGSSSREAWLSAMRIALDIVQYDLNGVLVQDVARVNERMAAWDAVQASLDMTPLTE